MSAPVTLIAEPFDAELAGLAPGGEQDGSVVALGDASGDDRVPAVRWLDRASRAEDAGAGESQPGLLIAPAGDGLWRCAPWPAADGLFDLDRPAAPDAPAALALLVGEGGLPDAVAERAAARGLALARAERLDRPGLEAASCVILADSPGGALPARAFAVLAARRLLVVPRLETGFGLEDGLDHLEFADPDEAVTAVEAFAAAPDAFGRVLTWGRLKAEPRRASVVYGRLAEDLRLLGLHAPA